MIRILVVLVSVVAVHSAPALLQQQYLFISPEAQLQLQPALKLQQPILQPIAQLRVPNLATKSDVLIYYPNAPLIQYPLVGLRQNWIEQIQQIFTEWTGGSGGSGGDDDSNTNNEDNDAEKLSKPSAIKDAEKIPLSKTPASTTALGAAPAPYPYFIVSQQPQFYGNYAGLQPIQPVLIKGRSVQEEPAVSDVETAAEPLNLKTEPLEQPESESVEINEPLPEPKNVDKEIVSARFQSDFPAVLNQNDDSAASEGKTQLKAAEDENKAPEPSEDALKVNDDPSVARTGPVGIALAGKSGLASSHPFGTALVGKGGLALSSPQGTSIAGDFLNPQEDKQ